MEKKSHSGLGACGPPVVICPLGKRVKVTKILSRGLDLESVKGQASGDAHSGNTVNMSCVWTPSCQVKKEEELTMKRLR